MKIDFGVEILYNLTCYPLKIRYNKLFDIGILEKYAHVAELADALDLGSSGRPWGFKSLHAHHKLSEKGKTER